MTVERATGPRAGVELVDRVLDGGIVIVSRDVLLSVFGLKLLALEAKVVTRTAQKYLEYAEAVGLMSLDRPRDVTEDIMTRPEVGAREALPRRILRWLRRSAVRSRRGNREA